MIQKGESVGSLKKLTRLLEKLVTSSAGFPIDFVSEANWENQKYQSSDCRMLQPSCELFAKHLESQSCDYRCAEVVRTLRTSHKYHLFSTVATLNNR